MSSRKPGPGVGGRWSDGETSALIDTWGPLHLRHNRRSLSAKEWRLVASAVNAHRAAAGRRFNRSHAQCQKRVYALRVQYKKELSKKAPSGWGHFSQLQAFLASPDGPPPGFPAKMLPALVKKEDETEVEVIGGVCGLVGRSTAPARRRFSSLQAILANLYGPPPSFPAKMPASVKEVEEEEMVGGGCGLVGRSTVPARRRFSSLQAILANLYGPPPSFPAKMPASVKEEEEEEMVGGVYGLVGSGARAAGCCPSSVVTKLADVYERVEVVKLNVEKEKMEMERKNIAFWNKLGAVKVREPERNGRQLTPGILSADEDEEKRPM